MEYQATLDLKQKNMENLFGKNIMPVIGMNFPYYYRYKVTYALGYDYESRQIVCGKYGQGSHDLFEIDDCLIESKDCQKLAHFITDLLPKLKIKVYDEDDHTGSLRYIFMRQSFATGDIMLVLVSADTFLPGKKHLIEEIHKNFPKVKSIYLDINKRTDSMVLTDDLTLLYGEKYLTDKVMGKSFRLSPLAFYQVNPQQMKKLYQTAVGFADLSGNEKIIDAYCGIGTIGICASDHASSIIGIENNRDAVHDAIFNAKANGVKNARYICGDAAELFTEKNIQADVVFMDPPRAGSSQKFLKSLMKLAPSKIVYISCNPETLARDTKILEKKYRLEKVQPVDMFPFTGHVETVCLLSKLSEVKNHISVEVDMDEMDLTAAESKATYQEIQEWVQEKYRFHVTHLNIAQVKRKHGIIERENYNKPKSEDSRQPGCPEEKEQAIEEALKHFQMII
jgi:23S rRNA (uracil1939-C5)-methyltransferase